MRVGLLIEDHKTGVDRHGPSGRSLFRIHGVGVPSNVGVGLEDRDVVVPVQKMSTAQTGYAGADDGDAGHSSGVSRFGWSCRGRLLAQKYPGVWRVIPCPRPRSCERR